MLHHAQLVQTNMCVKGAVRVCVFQPHSPLNSSINRHAPTQPNAPNQLNNNQCKRAPPLFSQPPTDRSRALLSTCGLGEGGGKCSRTHVCVCVCLFPSHVFHRMFLTTHFCIELHCSHCVCCVCACDCVCARLSAAFFVHPRCTA